MRRALLERNTTSPAGTGISPFVEAEMSLLISQEPATCYDAKPTIHSTLSPPVNIHYNINFLFTSRSYKWSLFGRVSPPKLCISSSSLSCVLRALSIIHLIIGTYSHRSKNWLWISRLFVSIYAVWRRIYISTEVTVFSANGDWRFQVIKVESRT